MNSTYSGKNGLREIESKKEALNALETALKKRVSEFKELCLKEGELTGHLPIDYPLQPREPIPQIRRRTKHNSDSCSSTNIINDKFSIAQPISIKSREHRLTNIQPQAAFAINSNVNMPFPSRPTSTNSTSSSISTSSSNTRNGSSIHNPLNIYANGHVQNSSIESSSSIKSSSLNNGCRNLYSTDPCNKLLRNHQPVRYDRSMLPNHFKRPFNLPTTSSFDSDALGHVRASSTASSSSSSGSGVSSTLSAPTVPNLKTSASLNSMANLHARSYSENIVTNSVTFHQNNISNLIDQQHSTTRIGQQQTFNLPMNTTNNSSCPPPRPPRGLTSDHRGSSENSKINGHNQMKTPSENSNNSSNNDQNSVGISQMKPIQHFNIDGIANFQPYYEETKPFQMSDFYKYSSKHRQTINDNSTNKTKTTRQLQEEVSKKYSLKLPSCDDQIQASVKLIERSGQKLIEATAKAIASNPGLAEKINNILPNNGDRY